MLAIFNRSFHPLYTLTWTILVVCAVHAYGKDSASIDDLFKKGTKADIKTIVRDSKKAPDEIRDAYCAVGFELNGYPREQIELLEPKIAENRKRARENPAFACMLAYAYACEHKPESATRVLGLIDDLRDDELVLADIQVVTGYVKQSLSQSEAARESLAQAKHHYKSAVTGPDYVTWHSRLIERRIKLLDEALKIPKSEKPPETPLAAWLAADKAGTASAYGKILESYPKTIYAEASELAMARLQLQNGDPESCLKALKSSPLLEGALADLAWITIGDAMVLDGKTASEAGEAYAQAIAILGKANGSKLKLDDEAKAALLPSEPLHSYDMGYPKWKARAPGQILLTSQDPRLLAYVRYQTVLKRSALAYAEGKRSSAATLARSLIMIDPVDRQMAQDHEGPGGLILESTWTKDKFIIALDCIADAKPEIRNSILMAVGFYQVYDFESSMWWLKQACSFQATSPKDRLACEFALSVQAFTLNLLGHKADAMKMAGEVPFRANESCMGPWILAKQLEASLYMDANPTDVDNALRCHQEVVDRAKRSDEEVKSSLIALCTISTYYKPEAAESYISMFVKHFPADGSIAASLKNDLKNQKQNHH